MNYKVSDTWFRGLKHYEGKMGRLLLVRPGMDRLHDGLLLRFADNTEEMFSRYEVIEISEDKARC